MPLDQAATVKKRLSSKSFSLEETQSVTGKITINVHTHCVHTSPLKCGCEKLTFMVFCTEMMRRFLGCNKTLPIEDVSSKIADKYSNVM